MPLILLENALLGLLLVGPLGRDLPLFFVFMENPMSLLSLSQLGDTMEKVAQGALSFTINDGPLAVKNCIDTGLSTVGTQTHGWAREVAQLALAAWRNRWGGSRPRKLVTCNQTVPITGTTGQSRTGLRAQSKVIWFPVSPATKEEQGSGKLRNKLFSRKPHAMFESTRENLAHQLRQIRPLRFPGP